MSGSINQVFKIETMSKPPKQKTAQVKARKWIGTLINPDTTTVE